MRDRQKSKDAAKLRDLKSLQKSAEQQALAEDQARVEDRRRDRENTSQQVEEAFEMWISNFSARAALDPARADLAARTLARCEDQLASATSRHDQAVEAAERQRMRLAECTTQLTRAEELVGKLSRRVSRHHEEQQQARLEERVAFEWFRHV